MLTSRHDVENERDAPCPAGWLECRIGIGGATCDASVESKRISVRGKVLRMLKPAMTPDLASNHTEELTACFLRPVWCPQARSPRQGLRIWERRVQRIFVLLLERAGTIYTPYLCRDTDLQS